MQNENKKDFDTWSILKKSINKINVSFKDLVVKNRNPLSGISQVPNGNNIISITEQDILSNIDFNIKIGERYIHYKTKDIYEIINICFLQVSKESGLDMEECVSYKKENDDRIWVRPIKMFLEKVKDEKGDEVQRFIKIKN